METEAGWENNLSLDPGWSLHRNAVIRCRDDGYGTYAELPELTMSTLIKMSKKLTGKALAKFEAERDVWQEVLDGVREIKAGGGKRTKIEAKSQVVRVRLKSGLSQAQFASALGVSKRTLEQWE